MVTFTVKNTFINDMADDSALGVDLERLRATRRRRGTSLPPQTKLWPEAPVVESSVISDDSTVASDNGEEYVSPRGVWFSQTSSYGECESSDACLGIGTSGDWPPVGGPLLSTPGGHQQQMPQKQMPQKTMLGCALVSTSPTSPGMLGPALSQASTAGQGVGILSAALSTRGNVGGGILAPAFAPSSAAPLLAPALAPSGGRIPLRRCLDPKARVFVPRPCSAWHPGRGARPEDDSASERGSCRAASFGRQRSWAASAAGEPEVPPPSRVGLSSKSASTDVYEVIHAAKVALAQDPSVRSVQVTNSPMGGTTTVTAHVPPGGTCDIDALRKVAQTELLEAAKRSPVVHFLGYGKQPFTDYETVGSVRFSAYLAVVKQSHQHIACWETYQQGCCGKPSGCRWKHPTASELMQLVVEIKRPFRRPL